ncbi:zinc finger, CCHC-type containing protein [Tanacetum coccineum]
MAAAMKHMALNFAKLEKFEGVDFRRWQKKMHFLLSSMSVVYVLTTPMPDDGGENPTVKQVRKRAKWDNDDYVCRGLILNGMFDSLFDVYQNVETSKELWDTLEAKYMAEDASSKKFLVSCIIDKLPPSWKDFKHTLKHMKEELTLIKLGSHLRIEESLRAQYNDKPKGNNVSGSSVVNMVEHNNSSRSNDNKGKHKHHDTRANPNKKPKVTYWKCGKPGHLKKDCKAGNVGNRANGSGTKGSEDGSSNPLKDRCWFKTYDSLNDGSILHMGNESTALVHGHGCVDIRFSSGNVVFLLNVLHVPNIRKNLVSSSILNNCGYKQVIESNKFVLFKHGVFIGFGYLCNHMFRLNIVSENIGSAFMSTSELKDSILWHARLGHVHFKRMQDMSKGRLIPAFDIDTEKYKTCMLTKISKKPFKNVKRETEVLELIHSDLCDLHDTPSLGNKKYFLTFIDDVSRFCYVYLLHIKDEALDKFKVFKTEVELQQGSLIKRFRTDRGGEYMDTLYFQYVGIIHETTAPYTPQQNGIYERKNRVLKEMVNSMLSYSGLSQGFWGEAMFTAYYLLNRVPNKRNRITPYKLWTKRKPNLNYLRVWGCRAVVRLPDPKLKTLGERGIKCIFVRYAEHSKVFRFYVIEPNDSVAINSIIESKDDIFDEHRFSSVPRPSQRSMVKGTEDSGGSVVFKKTSDEIVQQSKPQLRKSKRHRTPKDFGPEFQLYLIEGTRDEVSDQHSYCFNVEDDLKTFDEDSIELILAVLRSDNENPPPPPPQQTPTQQTPTQQAPYTVSTIKLPILKKDTNGVIKVLPPKTAEEILARERKRKARTTLLMALPEDHLVKFHKMTDAKEMWDAIKSRFGGVSTKDVNQKFLRSLPSSGSQVSLVMMTKPGVDSLSFDDLYNNLRVFESDVKGSTGSSCAQNIAFISSESTSSTNDVSIAYGIFTSSGYNSQRENSSSYTDELMYSFFANQSSGPQLDHEDLEQLDEFDLEEMDLKWQLALTRPRLSASVAITQGTLLESADQKEIKKAEEEMHGTLDIEQKTMGGDLENRRNIKLCNSGLDTEATSCSKECVESYAKLKKLYDEQREQLGDASIEIQAYTQALKKVEAQLVAHQKNQLWYEEKIRFMKIDLDDKTDVLTYHKKLLAEAVKEKEELKTKLENFQSSSKGLSKLLNSQMSAKDKSGLGYGNQIHEGVLSYEKEVLESVFDSRLSDVEDSLVHDRFTNIEGMHAVPPPMTENYMPPGPDKEVDDSMFAYGPKQSKTSESDTQTSNFDSCESNSSVETLESVPEPIVVEPKVVSQPKVWSDAPIIEEYESDSDDEYGTVKEQKTYSPSPKADKRDWNGLMSKRLGLGYGFTKKACFVCGSFSHLIRDCDFHEKRMAKHVELNKRKGKGTGQGENRPVWNNVQRLNHQNKFVPKAVLTKTDIFPVNTARQNLSSQAATTSTARKVNTVEVKAVSVVGGKRETDVKPLVVRRWTLDDMMMIWGSLYSFMRATYGAELVSAASLINTARPKLSTARLGWCCSKVFNNGVDAWIGSKMQFGLDLRVLNGN